MSKRTEYPGLPMDDIETIKAMFAVNAEAARLRDQEWREWWDRVAKEAGLRQSWFDKNLPPPDRRYLAQELGGEPGQVGLWSCGDRYVFPDGSTVLVLAGKIFGSHAGTGRFVGPYDTVLSLS